MTSSTSRQPNRLIHALSPYLLQHAHNPVDWQEWGPAPLTEAKEADKPIFLSIGYSACHWCHVMERESFENGEIATILNERFVCIKVDREERPDLDDLYMTATQAFTRSGGWPMSVWLTPDLRPFYAGTYFPPEARYGRPGFKEVLLFLADVWKNQRGKALQQAEAITEGVRLLTSLDGSPGKPAADLVPRSAAALASMFDPTKGGFSAGGPNKFPPCMTMDLLLRTRDRGLDDGSHDPAVQQLLELVTVTLDRMAGGGIYDHLGGGFARYSTDPNWLVPHFEKMLYDQALLADIYLKAWQVTRKPLYARIACETLDYALTDLQSPEGGFYSTRDADSEGIEGKFYVWSKAEIEALLGDDALLFCDYFDVTDEGNWDHHNILHTPRPLDLVARLSGLTEDQAQQRVDRAKVLLREVREQRVKPQLDDKVLTAWNGLMISSLARAGRALGEPRFRKAAVRTAAFLTDRMLVDGRLHRVHRRGCVQTPGFLDDYAFLIAALLDCYETTFEAHWLDQATTLNDRTLRLFHDPRKGGFYTTGSDAEQLLLRIKDFRDSAIPSGNAVQIMNLLRLAVLLDRPDLERIAEQALELLSGQVAESPFQGERMLAAVDLQQRGATEVLFVGRSDQAEAMDRLMAAVWQTHIPNLVADRLLVDSPIVGRQSSRTFPPSDGKTVAGGPVVYICRSRCCLPPERDPERVVRLLAR